MAIPIIDVFAGPGGLGEGFSSLKDELGQPKFDIAASIEMDHVACQTLKLRSLFRNIRGNEDQERLYWKFVKQEISFEEFLENGSIADLYQEVSTHVHQIELGSESRAESDQVIESALLQHGVTNSSDKPWVLIGGPPCQAYSLAGRSRRANDKTFASDKKHFLYQEYLHILAKFKPVIFIMENVKGLLSAQATGDQMFQKILNDLSEPTSDCAYEIHSIVVNKTNHDYAPKDFVVRSEEYGVPQKRHRVILLGIRKDFSSSNLPFDKTLKPAEVVTVRDAISDLPHLRSGMTPKHIDSEEQWTSFRNSLFEKYGEGRQLGVQTTKPVTDEEYCETNGESYFSTWVRDVIPSLISQHQARSHMKMDLARYFYYALVAAKSGISIKISDLPIELLPAHKNANNSSGHFSDRFRVQLWDKPSTTVVSHISKDGHYYIHPDPMQMRSLTVREAARLQTFPDSYHFMGNRTQQYHQVGNAVPPLLARQIAEVVEEYLAGS